MLKKAVALGVMLGLSLPCASVWADDENLFMHDGAGMTSDEVRARWNALTPAQRTAMHQRYEALAQLPSAERDRLMREQDRFHHRPPEERARIRSVWQQMTPEIRRVWQERMEQATPIERKRLRDDLLRSGFAQHP